MKILGLIPARGGSKGVKNKNIIDLNGYPLIYYTIREAFKINAFHRVFVSTDNNKIKSIAESYGCNIPFLRPNQLAEDNVRTIDVVVDLLNTMRNDFNEEYDYVCLLQPTSPLRKAKDIQNCIDIIKDKGKGSVISLSKVDEPHPNKMKIIKNNLIYPLIEGTNSSIPRQELPPVYELNGAVYLSDIKTIIKNKSFFNKESHPYIMPIERSVNINNSIDLLKASILMNKQK